MIPFEEISLYFHIPFCKRKCDYCHFYVLPEQENEKDLLLQGFQLELALQGQILKNKRVASIYFGGGTPSLFAPSRIEAVLNQILIYCNVLPDAEITLEANPENITPSLMQGYRLAGINRLSMGIQTLDRELLQLLGRLHDPEIAIRAVHTVFEEGISNISIDLMYDLPKQTLVHWESTLHQIQTLPLRHLSLYNLTIEPHTLFFKKQADLQPLLPSQEASLAMYLIAKEKLEAIGLKQYEISAFAQPGFESRHNTGYWTGRSFLGLGPSAFSYWEGKRFRNVSHLKKYIQFLQEGKSPVDFEEKLDPDAHRRELFVVQLRLKKGVDLEQFKLQHGLFNGATDKSVQRLIDEGFLIQENSYLHLTEKGILFYDTLAAELI